MRLTRFLITIIYLLAPTISYGEELTPAKKSAIKELLQITGTIQVAKIFGDYATQHTINILKKTKPDIDPRAFNIIKEEFDAHTHEELVIKESFYPYFYPIYHKYLTLEEIKGLIQFYKTPLGRKTVNVMPKMTQEGMKAGEAWAEAVFGSEFERKLSNRLQREGIKLDK